MRQITDAEIAAIRQAMPMRALAESYGFKVHHGDMISCPFHGDDRNPSMKLYPGDKGYYCFTCNKGGDVIDFVRQYEGLDFEAATRKVAALAGITLGGEAPKLSKTDWERIYINQGRKQKREEHKRQLERLADKIHCYEAFQEDLEPLSDLWCRLQLLKEKAEREWNSHFEVIHEFIKKQKGA